MIDFHPFSFSRRRLKAQIQLAVFGTTPIVSRTRSSSKHINIHPVRQASTPTHSYPAAERSVALDSPQYLLGCQSSHPNPMPAAEFGHDNSALLCLVTGARLEEARVLSFAFVTFTFITSARRLMGGSRLYFSPALTAFFAPIRVSAPPRTSTLFFIFARGARSTRLRGSVVGGACIHLMILSL